MGSPNQLRNDADRLQRLLRKPDVREAMRARCESQGHQMENGITANFVFRETCSWCGDTT